MFVHLEDLFLTHPFDDRPVALFQQVFFAAEIDQMPGFYRLGFQVELVVWVGWNEMWDAPIDRNPIFGQVFDLARVIGH